MRDGLDAVPLAREMFAVSGDLEVCWKQTREPRPKTYQGRMRLRFVQAMEIRCDRRRSGSWPDDATPCGGDVPELNMGLTRAGGHQTAERLADRGTCCPREGVAFGAAASMMVSVRGK